MCDPVRLDALESTAIDLVQSALNPSTVHCYNSTLIQFQQFLSSLDSRYKGLPANPGQVILFIAELYKQGLSSSTIFSKMSAITYYHKLSSLPDPMEHFLVKKCLAGVRHLASTSDSRLPITITMLQSMLGAAFKVVSSDYYIKLFRAMMVLSFFALLRPGEVTASNNNLLFQNIVLTQQQISVTFMTYKHHKGKPVTLIVPSRNGTPCPVQILAEYLAVRGSKPGPLFDTSIPNSLSSSLSHSS